MENTRFYSSADMANTRFCSSSDMANTRFYSSADMAKVYCEKCNGCGDCCHNMTDTIHLDPYDINMLETGLGKTFDELINEGRIALHEEDGLIIPHLKMNEGTPHQGSLDGACSFLGSDNRCSIHSIRPGLCRLFPLGRDYDADTRTFRYFVVDNGCDMPGKMKVKITKWLGIPSLKQYEQFVSDWHYFVKDVKKKLSDTDDEEYRKQLDMFILKVFYIAPYDRERSFYESFEIRLKQARTVL